MFAMVWLRGVKMHQQQQQQQTKAAAIREDAVRYRTELVGMAIVEMAI